MATFTNRATLSYNNSVTSSNTVTGEIVEVLSVTKTAVLGTYKSNDTITYVVGITNSGSLPYTALTLTDDLGAYGFGDPATTVIPLTYVENSLLYYVNGVLMSAPTVAETEPMLNITGITVPAGGNAVIVYDAAINEFAPLDTSGSIKNTLSVSGSGLASALTAVATVTPENAALLTISKALSPSSVAENGQITYTFVIQNYGNTDAGAADNAVIRDVFSPVLDPISAEFNGIAWSEGTDYSYDPVTGVFESTAGRITVPKATYTQDSATGAWNVEPGTSVLKITGNIKSSTS